MRIISKGGHSDLPYEEIALCMASEDIIARHNDKEYLMARYSTMEKAQKAMEMLREQYMKLGMIKILASGTCEYMDKSLEKEEKMEIYADYCRKHCFKFPDDSEVEV